VSKKVHKKNLHASHVDTQSYAVSYKSCLLDDDNDDDDDDDNQNTQVVNVNHNACTNVRILLTSNVLASH
jgi:hypothetical protein